MAISRTAHSVCRFVPPYILEAIARNAPAEDGEWARRTLATDATLRAARMARPPLRVRPEGLPPHKQREVSDSHNSSDVMGTLVRSEGQPATGNQAVDEAYNGTGATFDLYWDIFQRNSIDNQGMDLDSTVHFKQNYDNAFWNGQRMVFGDGDGKYYNRFTIAVDIMGHEMTHGVVSYEAELKYQDQSGALDESIADVFGSLVKQYSQSPPQTADRADWLIGAGLFTSRVNGVALRSMKAPGTAYNDSVLGKDPQPADMADYVVTAKDDGGVHINSGIPNHAFYLLAIALGGYAWEKAGPVWYAALRDARLSPTAKFEDFAYLTADNANRLFGRAVNKAVISAWSQVGITVRPLPPRTAGDSFYELLLTPVPSR